MKKINTAIQNFNAAIFLAAIAVIILATASCKNGTSTSTTDSTSTDKKVLLGSGKDSFHITGFVEGLKDQNIYLGFNDSTGKNVGDSFFVKDGHFNFKGKVAYPHVAAFMLGDGLTSVSFVIDNEDYDVKGKTDTLYGFILDIKGSPLQVDFQKSEDLVKNMKAESGKYNLAAYDASLRKDVKAMKEFQAKTDSMEKVIFNVRKKFITENPDKLSALFLFENIMIDIPADSALEMFKKFHPDVQKTFVGEKIKNTLESIIRTAVGKEATEVEQPGIDGKMVKLSDFKGKYVLLDFWASWCGPCRAENPNVLKAYNKFKDKNFTVLGISLDENGDNWKKAVQEDKMPWTQASDLKGFNSPAAKAYGIQAIPANYLIDPSGKIVAKDLREGDLMKKLSELIK